MPKTAEQLHDLSKSDLKSEERDQHSPDFLCRFSFVTFTCYAHPSQSLDFSYARSQTGFSQFHHSAFLASSHPFTLKNYVGSRALAYGRFEPSWMTPLHVRASQRWLMQRIPVVTDAGGKCRWLVPFLRTVFIVLSLYVMSVTRFFPIFILHAQNTLSQGCIFGF